MLDLGRCDRGAGGQTPPLEAISRGNGYPMLATVPQLQPPDYRKFTFI
jgi:hypothetical protein